MIHRRNLLIAFAALGLTRGFPLFAQPGPRRVHVLSLGTDRNSGPGMKTLDEGFRALGWKDSGNLRLVFHFAGDSTESLARLAAEIVRANPEVIIAYGPGPAVDLKKTGTVIPIVFVAIFDPVKLGLAQSLARPGGSITGLSTAVTDSGFFAKQLSLLREVVPKAPRLALLSNPRNPIHVLFRDLRVQTARELGFEPIEVQASAREELEPAFREAARRGAGAIYVGGDPVPMSEQALVAELALRHRLPTFFLFHQHVEAGGLMSYGTDLTDLSRRAAGYVDKILKGAKPGDLPIQQPTKFDFVINLKTAKALGLKIPQSLLLRADRVIE